MYYAFNDCCKNDYIIAVINDVKDEFRSETVRPVILIAVVVLVLIV